MEVDKPLMAYRRLALQLDYVQTPEVLDLAIQFLAAEGLTPGQGGLEVGMNIATPANFINAEGFLQPELSFVAIEPTLLLMNLALADPENEVMVYDGTMQPLVDPQEPEFREALRVATQMVKTVAAQRGVKLAEPAQPLGILEPAVQAPDSVLGDVEAEMNSHGNIERQP